MHKARDRPAKEDMHPGHRPAALLPVAFGWQPLPLPARQGFCPQGHGAGVVAIPYRVQPSQRDGVLAAGPQGQDTDGQGDILQPCGRSPCEAVLSRLGTHQGGAAARLDSVAVPFRGASSGFGGMFRQGVAGGEREDGHGDESAATGTHMACMRRQDELRGVYPSGPQRRGDGGISRHRRHGGLGSQGGGA